MFRKLVSNLPYSPSLANQVVFYAQRLSKEELIRRLGLIFMALAILVQAFTFVSPAEPSIASSGNDIIEGGGTKEQIINAYVTNRDSRGHTDIQQIFNYFKVDLNALQNTYPVQIQSRPENNFWSIGRDAQGFEGEYQINANGAIVYARPLHAWDTGAYSTYTAYQGKTTDGKDFWVLNSCGNIVFKPLDGPVDLDIVKGVYSESGEDLNGKTVTPGQVLKYVLWYTNKGPSAAVYEVKDGAPISTVLQGPPSFYNYSFGTVTVNDGTNFTLTSLPFGVLPPHSPTQQGSVLVEFYVRVNDNVSDGEQICNSATISRVNPPEQPVVSNQVCVHVNNPPEEVPPTEELPPIIVINKEVSNTTQQIEDANGTTAAAGDVLEYSLVVENQGETTFDNYEFPTEDISDILEYSDLIDQGDADFEPNEEILSWSSQSVQPGESVVKTFTVKVKDPIPSSPISASNPASFDLIMSNVYGPDTVLVHLPTTPQKTVENVVRQLPNTGAGSNFLMSSILLMAVVYFYSRTKQLSKELTIIKKEYNY